MDYAALVDELKAGDYSIDAAKGVPVERAREIAEALNTPRATGTEMVRLETQEVLDALANEGEIAKIEDPQTTEAQALGVYLYATGGLDMSVGSNGRRLLKAVVSTAAHDRVVAAATRPVVQSWAEEHGCEPVGDGHVLSAVRMLEVA
jgi:hypothetical protein